VQISRSLSDFLSMARLLWRQGMRVHQSLTAINKHRTGHPIPDAAVDTGPPDSRVQISDRMLSIS
jgi:hypothetical protein